MSQDDTDGWSKRARIGLLVLGILLGAVAAPAIYAQVQTTEDYHMGEGMVIGSPSGLQVELGQDLTNDRQHLSPSDDAVDLRPVRFEADGSAYVNVSGWDTPYLVLDDLDASSNPLRVRPAGSHSDVTIDGAASRVEVGSVAVDDGTDDVRVTTSGSTTLQVWGLPAEDTVIAVDGDTGDRIQTFQTDGEGAGTFTLSESRDVQFQSAQAPTITDPQPADGTTVSNYSTTLSADVSDLDFEGVGDDVTVTFYDVDAGTQLHQETISSEQTVSTDWSGLDMGENRWNVTAVDSDGNQVALGPFTVRAPKQLEIRDETTQDLITGSDANVTVRFFPTSEDTGTIVSRSTDDGTLNLTGLPTDQDIVVDADADGYRSRSIIVRDLAELQSIYLLDENATIVSPTFQIQDRTQNFPSDESRLIIRRPLDSGGDTATYRTIVGDTFGADEQVSPVLESGARYRIIVESPDGEIRSFGSYLADSDELVTLDIGELSIGAPGSSGYVFNAGTADGGDSIRLTYRDAEELTSEISITVYEQHNESNVIFGPETVQNPTEYQETIPIPNASADVDRWVVDYEIERGGETIDGQTLVGDIGDLDLPVDSAVLQTVGLFGILLIAGLFGGSLSRTGAVVVVVVAWLLSMVGIVTIPWPALFAAGSIAFLFKIAEVGVRGP